MVGNAHTGPGREAGWQTRQRHATGWGDKPLLANLYLHYTLERWFEINFPDVCFVRYADEVTVHCKSKEQAEEVLQAVKSGLAAAKLSIKESKTKIAYCKGYRRKSNHGHVQFNFLGFSFKPMKMRSKHSGYYTGFGATISTAKGTKKLFY